MMRDLGLYDENSSQARRPSDRQDLCTRAESGGLHSLSVASVTMKGGPWIW